MVELAFTQDLKSCARKGLRVRLPSVPLFNHMIIIIVKSGHKFYYKGNIELRFDDTFIWISAYLSSIINDDELLTSQDCLIHDAFWLDDIESIYGE